jgi:ubiquinone/menaquinone biosynthesis C-methylase UbiE
VDTQVDWSKQTEYDPDNLNATKMGEYLTQKELQFIDSIIKTPNLNILDIGGGSGRFAIPLSEKGGHVTVLDISGKAIELLNKKSSGIKTIVGDGETYQFKGKYDCILVIETIEYIKDIESFFKKCRELLNDNGIIIVTMCNRHSYKMLHPHRRTRPWSYFATEYDFKMILEKCGFKIVKSRGFNWLPFGRGSDSSLIPVCAGCEDFLGLGELAGVSPWVIFAGRK